MGFSSMYRINMVKDHQGIVILGVCVCVGFPPIAWGILVTSNH